MIKSKIKIKSLITILLIGISFMWHSSMLYASSTVNPYEKESLEIKEIEKMYHKKVNDIFNSKLTLLKQGEKGKGTAEVPKNDQCGENNYSTYCLAVTVAKEYDQYAVAMDKRKSYIKITEENMTLTQASLTTINQRNEVENELNRSKLALDMAVKTYDEILVSYKLHMQYEKIIKSLTKYNKKLIEYRKEVEKLPGKFIDASTTQCT